MKKVHILLFFIFLIIFVPGAAYGEHSVFNGTIDLRNYDLSHNSVKLNGQWEFYWNRLIQPGDFEKYESEKKYIKVPKFWPTAEGYATYRLKVIVKPNNNELLSLKIPRLLNSYKMWINGQLLSSYGVVTTTPDGNGKTRPTIISFNNTSDKIDIVIQMSNYIEKRGGIPSSFTLGTSNNIQHINTLNTVKDAFLFGLIFIMGCYHLILFLFYRKDIAPLLLSILCFAVATRTVVSEECLLLQFFSISTSTHFCLTHFSMAIAVIAISGFFYMLFPKEFNKYILGFFVTGHVCFMICMLIFSSVTPIALLTSFYIFTILNGFFILFVVIIAVFRKRENSIVMLIGSSIFLILFVSDIFRAIQIINIPSLSPFALSIFLFTQSVVLARKFTNAFKSNERLNDKLMAIDKLKDEFLANTSHELLTPLNGIIGLADSLTDGIAGNLPQKALTNMKMISASGKRLANIIHDILDFSKLKNHDILLYRKNVELKQVVELVLTISRPLIKDRLLELKNMIPENLPYIWVDENRLQQILYNLIGNAIKFTPEGWINVYATEKNDFVEITVEDTGIGIPKDKFDMIFKSFEQIDSSKSLEFGGAGLGLSITKHQVELHGGKIWVESVPGKGSKFIFTIPVSTNKNAEETSAIPAIIMNNTDTDQPVHNCNNHKPSILVVDDEVVNLQIMFDLLTLQNYFVLAASSGLEAIQLTKDHEFDLVLLDVMMPKMSGYEVCRFLRKKYTIFELPIIMLTSKNTTIDILAGFEAGANDYLLKPFNRQELVARVQTLVNLKYATKQALLNKQLSVSEKLESFSQIIAGIAHNLKTPLMSTSLLLNEICRLIQEYDAAIDDKEITAADHHEIASDMDKSAGNIKDMLIYIENIVNSLREQIVVINNSQEDKFTIDELFHSIATLTEQELRQNSCSINLENGTSSSITGNMNALIQVIKNLISNSIYSYESKEGTIELRAVENSSHITISVSDHGRGISKDISKKLFKQMVTDKGNNGTGLGLYLSYNTILSKFSGEMYFESAEGKGSVFYIKIPV